MKVLLYGAGSGGRNFYKNTNVKGVVGFVDSDIKKSGKSLEGLPIYHWRELAHLEYDEIIVTSTFYREIEELLIEHLHVHPDKVSGAPKGMLAENPYPFKDERTHLHASRALEEIVGILKKKNIYYHLDFGTLLGIYRDREIMRWDDDIDLGARLKDVELIKNAMLEYLESIELNLNSTINVFLVKSCLDVPVELKIEILPNEKSLNSYTVGIYFYDLQNEQWKNRVSHISADLIGEGKIFEIDKQSYNIPANVEEYLEALYGDWKTPNPNMVSGTHLSGTSSFTSEELLSETIIRLN